MSADVQRIGQAYAQLLAGIARDFNVSHDAAASIVARVGHWQTTCDACDTRYGPDGNCPTCNPAEPEDEPDASGADHWLLLVDLSTGRPEVVLDLPGGPEDEAAYKAATDRAAAYHRSPARLMACRVVHRAVLTTLRVWTDGEDWIIADSAERAHELRAASYGERPEDLGDLADWKALPDDRVVRVYDELDDEAVSRTAAEWVAAEGKEGFLCSTEY